VDAADFNNTLISLLTIFLLVGSIAFWVWTFRTLRKGGVPVPERFHWKPVRVPRLALFLNLILLVFYLQAVVRSQGLIPNLTPEEIRMTLQGMLFEGGIVLAVIFPALFFGTRSRTDRYRLGLRCHEFREQIREGALGLIAAVLPVGLMLVVMSSIRTPETEHPFLRLLRDSPHGPEALIVIVSAVILAPLKEELMFRVILQSWLEEFCPAWLAVVGSSLVFAAVHGFPDAVALIPLALILGYLFQRRRSYLAVVTLHALFNAYNVLATIMSSS